MLYPEIIRKKNMNLYRALKYSQKLSLLTANPARPEMQYGLAHSDRVTWLRALSSQTVLLINSGLVNVDVFLPISWYVLLLYQVLLVKFNSPFFGMKYYLDVEKCFGVAIVAPPVNHYLPTILGGNGLPRYSLPGS